MDETWLNLAREAIQQNDIPRACGLLRGYVKYYPKDAAGWHWLSRVAETTEEKKRCLQRAVELDPQNAGASQELATLSGRVARPVQAPAKKTAKPNPQVERALSPQPVHSPVLSPSFVNIVKWIAFALSVLFFLAIAITTLPIFFGNRTLVVMSGSMEPAVPVGAVVVAKTVPSQDLVEGEVIVFSSSANATPVVHRIVQIRIKDGVRLYTTRGDANPTSDVAEITLSATAWRMAYNIPLVGYLIYYVTSPLGTMIFIVLPLLLLGVLTIWEQVKKYSRGTRHVQS